MKWTWAGEKVLPLDFKRGTSPRERNSKVLLVRMSQQGGLDRGTAVLVKTGGISTGSEVLAAHVVLEIVS